MTGGIMRKWISVLCLAAGIAAAQQGPLEKTPQQHASAPTFRTATKLVQVDVVAKRKDASDTGLTKHDFTLPDNGKPQKISFFSVRSAQIPGRPGGTTFAPLPAGAVSNR